MRLIASVQYVIPMHIGILSLLRRCCPDSNRDKFGMTKKVIPMHIGIFRIEGKMLKQVQHDKKVIPMHIGIFTIRQRCCPDKQSGQVQHGNRMLASVFSSTLFVCICVFLHLQEISFRCRNASYCLS